MSRLGWPGLIASAGSVLGLLALPACMGVAILRYRLYDIDRVISRTLAWALITGVLVGVYAGLVLAATHLFKLHSSVAVAAATLAAAALFNPVRRRVQRAMDRRFNRARYDADTMVAAFAARLMDAVELDAIRTDLAAVVDRALEPEHVRVWTSQARLICPAILKGGFSCLRCPGSCRRGSCRRAGGRDQGGRGPGRGSGPGRRTCIGRRYIVLRYIGPRCKVSVMTEKLDRWADPPLLVLASLAAEPKHGYAITQDVADTMGVRLSPGTSTRSLPAWRPAA